MLITKPFHGALKNIFILSVIAALTALTACGGGGSGTKASSTPADTTPAAFSFAAAQNVQPRSENISNTITVSGINAVAPISITNGGEYSIGSGAYKSTAGTVTNGQTVTVKAQSPAAANTTVNVVLTIGGVPATYSITTPADTTAPTAKILFPPVVSMTEGNTILVRGTASDDWGNVKSIKIKVNGAVVTTDIITSDNFANWQASVPLTDTTAPVTATTENVITVVAEDNAAHIENNAAQVSIRQAPLNSSFPDGDNKFSYNTSQVVIDRLDGRNRFLVNGTYDHKITSVDMATGVRSPFVNAASIGLGTLAGFVIEPVSKHLYALEFEKENLVEFDLASGALLQKYYFDFDGNNAVGGSSNIPWDLTLDDTSAAPKIIAINNNYDGGGGGNSI
jgi:hypothetical protein